jgi:AAA+ ATPase superfamily predicted ATPase
MTFYDLEKELEALTSAFESAGPDSFGVYGRRRVWKLIGRTAGKLVVQHGPCQELRRQLFLGDSPYSQGEGSAHVFESLPATVTSRP